MLKLQSLRSKRRVFLVTLLLLTLLIGFFPFSSLFRFAGSHSSSSFSSTSQDSETIGTDKRRVSPRPILDAAADEATHEVVSSPYEQQQQLANIAARDKKTKMKRMGNRHRHRAAVLSPEVVSAHEKLLYFPQRRSPIDSNRLNCDPADALLKKQNDGNEDEKQKTQPCLRSVFFSTLKPCTSDENIWTQFTAISSWAAAKVYPAPVIVLFDTSLRRLKDDDGGRIVQRNYEEAEFVKKFANETAAIKLDAAAFELGEDEIDAEEENAAVAAAVEADEFNYAPAAVQESCGWLLAKMVENFYPEPLRNASSSTSSTSSVQNRRFFAPRVVVAVPPDELVGQEHQTLLLGPAVKYVSSVLAPVLRPEDSGIFDVVGFINSDIVFGSRLGALLVNGLHIMRRFMFTGRRRSLSFDAAAGGIVSAFSAQKKINHGNWKVARERRRMAVQRERQQRYEMRAPLTLAAAAGDAAGAVEKKSGSPAEENNDYDTASIRFDQTLRKYGGGFPGQIFYDHFFPIENDAFVDSDLAQLLKEHGKKGGRGDRIDAEDFFFWSKSYLDFSHLQKEVPPFHIGRPAFDNWLVTQCIHSMQPVVDLSNSGLMVVHIEKSLRKNKNNKVVGADGVERPERAYWSGDDSSTKENYRLGEKNGGWMHGLLEFIPLHMEWIGAAAAASSVASLAPPPPLRSHELGEVRVGMKPTWKGIGSGLDEVSPTVRTGLETPESYWRSVQRFF